MSDLFQRPVKIQFHFVLPRPAKAASHQHGVTKTPRIAGKVGNLCRYGSIDAAKSYRLVAEIKPFSAVFGNNTGNHRGLFFVTEQWADQAFQPLAGTSTGETWFGGFDSGRLQILAEVGHAAMRPVVAVIDTIGSIHTLTITAEPV